MSNPDIAVGARGAIVPFTPPMESVAVNEAVINDALSKPGILYYSESPQEWICVRNVAPLMNNNGETVREGVRVEIKFVDKLYFLSEEDPFYAEKKKHLEKLPWYGTRIRPMSEITRENKAKAQEQAIKTLAQLGSDPSTLDLIAALASKFELSPEVKATLDSVMSAKRTAESKPSTLVIK